MRVRIIHVTYRRSGAEARRDEIVDVPVISLGRGVDNTIALDDLTVPLHYGTIERGADGTHLCVRSDVGSAAGKARLELGDVVRIGPYELSVVAPATDEDLALEVKPRPRLGSELDQLRSRTRLGSPRVLATAWWFALAAAVAVAAAALAPTTRPHQQWAWNVGRMSAPHAYLASECGACHVAGPDGTRGELVPLPAAVRAAAAAAGSKATVTDAACLVCHAAQLAHVPTAIAAAHVPEPSCISCHREHRGSGNLLVVTDDRCTSACHADLERRVAGDTEIKNVATWADHPAFRVTLGVGKAGDDASAPMPARRVRWTADLQEASGVKFNHLHHVGRATCEPRTPKSYMKCDECHRVDNAGRNFLPIDFETHCERCHSLRYDERFPDDEAPHADPAIVIRALRNRYAQRAVFGDAPPAAAVRRDLPSPRRVTSGACMPAGPCTTAACVDWEVKYATCFLMGPGEPCGDGVRCCGKEQCHDTECARCHDIVPRADGVAVAPVNISTIWFPEATFSHQAHAAYACNRCHPAAAVFDGEFLADHPDCRPERPPWSEAGTFALRERDAAHVVMGTTRATDILVPQVSLCRECHFGPGDPAPTHRDGMTGGTPMDVSAAHHSNGDATNPIESRCTLCHVFHRPELGPRQTLRVAAGAGGAQ